MKRIIIEGEKELTGTIRISGAKNSVVALLPASILSSDKVKISNVPNISDRDALYEILSLLNVVSLMLHLKDLLIRMILEWYLHHQIRYCIMINVNQ